MSNEDYFIDTTNAALAKARELQEQMSFLVERLVAKDKIIRNLKRAKFSVARVYLREDIADRSLYIISVDSSSDGLIIRVAK